MALRKFSNSPLGMLIKKFEAQLAKKGLSVKDSMKVFLQVLQGIAEGLMRLDETPDFVACVFNGMTAEKYFKSLTPANVATVNDLVKTINGTK